jgi:hypothetical protein
MAKTGSTDSYQVVWPQSERQQKQQPLAKRLDDLNGKTIAQLWDFRYRGNEVYRMLEEDLRERFPDIRFVSWQEFGSTYGSDERDVAASLPRRFKELGVDAAISSMGC